MKKVVILLDSDANKHIADRVIEVLERYSVLYQLESISPYKQPAQLRELVKGSDADAFICVAGLSAALPGIVSSITAKPVIGVPVDQKVMGIDALLSMAQMPDGVPVATMGIDNAKNAAYLALRILALKYPEILHSQGMQASQSYSSQSQQERYDYHDRDYSDRNYDEPKKDESQAAQFIPDFMLSPKPLDPVTFDKLKENEPVKRERLRPRGDWWM